VFVAERQLETTRRHAMHLLTLAGNARNHSAQAEESLAALEREAERLETEMRQARNEQENLGVERGQARCGLSPLQTPSSGWKRDRGTSRDPAGQTRGRERTAVARQPTAR
jgi:chromosome segregation protein